MKNWMKWLLCLMVLFFCVQAASAFTVKQISVPKTDLRANDNVKVELEISMGTFTATHDLQFSSDLNSTVLIAEMYNDETKQYDPIQVTQDRSGKWFILGWLLPSDRSFIVRISFSGTVPSAVTGGNLSVVSISELSGGAVVSGSEYKLERQVINPQEVTSQMTSVRADLQTFKQTIVTQGSTGVDTSAASGKVTEAENALTKADSLKSTSYSQAIVQLDAARNAIKDGYILLDKAGAQHEIDQVEQTMSQVESMVTYFTVNRSISQTDSRLVAITNKYDLASQSISSAHDMVNAGNYLNGKAKALEAAKYANDAYNLSTTMKTELGEGGIALPGINPMFLVLGIGVIAIGVVGYFAYRKFFHWDELG
ncbi:MAG: hypothetical protein LUO93_01425 [Methanomicrobiales archaeon]|nr:hypothetical protein [Methanomicrobiales archaeon]